MAGEPTLPVVWLNGRFVARGEALVSVFDAGFLHGIGLFETIAASGGRAFRAREHVTRLVESAQRLLLSDRLHVDPLVEAIGQAVECSGLERARVRLTVTGGDLNYLQSRDRGQGDRVDPAIVIVVQPPTSYPEAFFSEGVTVVVADGRQNPFDPTAGHKTLNYWPRIHALQRAAMQRAGEALWFTVSNHLASGSVSNVFLVKDDRLLTPIARGEEVAGGLPSPVLPGITRAVIRECGERRGLELETRMLDIEDVLDADEVFLTNSSWGVLPVVALERETIGAGAVGPVTRTLREAWLEQQDAGTAQ